MRLNEQNRGQLLIVGGLVIAVSLILLVTLLNATLFAHNQSAQSPAPDAENPQEFRKVANQEYGNFIVEINNLEAGSQTTGFVRDNVSTLNEAFVVLNGESSGVFAESEVDSVNTGVMIRQDELRNFTDRNGEPLGVLNTRWEVVESDNVRRYRLSFNRSELPSTSITGTLAEGDSASSISSFINGNWRATMNSSSSSNAWEISVFRDDTGNVYVVTREKGEDWIVKYKSDKEHLDVGVTTGEVNNQSDKFEYIPARYPRHSITWVNPKSIRGRYTVVADDSATIDSTRINSGSSSPSPYETEAVYSVSLDVSYDTATIEYEDELLIEPCTANSSRCYESARYNDRPDGTSGIL